MLRKIMMLLLAATMLLSCAGAEEAVNPFIGTWDVLFYILDIAAPTPKKGDHIETIVVEENSITMWFGEESRTFWEYTYDSTSFTCGDTTFVLQSKDEIICQTDDFTIVATRVDPTLLIIPFIGTWTALCVVDDGEVSVPPEDEPPITLAFTQDTITSRQEEYVVSHPCTYKDGICTISNGVDSAYCTIGEDGLMRIYAESLDSDYYAILSNTEEVVPDYISQFLGEWLMLATSNPEGVPDPQPTAIFTRSYIYSPMDDEYTLCSYTEDGCIWYYEGEPFVTCTIDANGLMTATADYDNQTLWFVRVNPEPADQ